MCKTYASRFQCGHSKVRVASTCRGTYACSLTPNVPRCTPTNDIMVVRIAHACQDCQYASFCNENQEKIDELTSNRDALSDLLNDFDSSDDVWDGDDFGSESADESSTSSLFGCDAASIRRQRDNLNMELSALQKQYDQQAWALYHSGAARSSAFSSPKKTQKRRTAPRSAGASRLSQVTLASEIPSPEPEVVDESDSDDAFLSDDDASTVSASSVPTTPSNDLNENVYETPFKAAFNDTARTNDWIQKLQSTPVSEMAFICEEDEDNELFPAWGNA